MIYATPPLEPADRKVLELIGQQKERLKVYSSDASPRRWRGSLRRSMLARAIQGSNSIEGYPRFDQGRNLGSGLSKFWGQLSFEGPFAALILLERSNLKPTVRSARMDLSSYICPYESRGTLRKFLNADHRIPSNIKLSVFITNFKKNDNQTLNASRVRPAASYRSALFAKGDPNLFETAGCDRTPSAGRPACPYRAFSSRALIKFPPVRNHALFSKQPARCK